MTANPQPPPSIPVDLEARRQAMLYRARGLTNATPINSAGNGLNDNQGDSTHQPVVMSSLPVAHSTNRLFDDEDDGKDSGADPGKLLALLKKKKKERQGGTNQAKTSSQSSIERKRTKQPAPQAQSSSAISQLSKKSTNGIKNIKDDGAGAEGSSATTPEKSAVNNSLKTSQTQSPQKQPLSKPIEQSIPLSEEKNHVFAIDGAVVTPPMRLMAAVIGVTPTATGAGGGAVDDISPFSSLSTSTSLGGGPHPLSTQQKNLNNNGSFMNGIGSQLLDSPPHMASTTVPSLPTGIGNIADVAIATTSFGSSPPQPLNVLNIGNSMGNTQSSTTTPTKQSIVATPKGGTVNGNKNPLPTSQPPNPQNESTALVNNLMVSNGSLASAPTDGNSPTNNLARYLPPSRVGLGSLQRPMTPSTVRPPTQQRQVQSAMAWAMSPSPNSPFIATNTMNNGTINAGGVNNNTFSSLSPSAKTNGLSVVTKLPTKNITNKLTTTSGAATGISQTSRSLSHSGTPSQPPLLTRQKQRRGSHDGALNRTSSIAKGNTSSTSVNTTIKNRSVSTTGYQPDIGSDSLSPDHGPQRRPIPTGDDRGETEDESKEFIENTNLPNPSAIPVSRKTSQLHFPQKNLTSPSPVGLEFVPSGALQVTSFEIGSSDSFTNVLTAMPMTTLLGGLTHPNNGYGARGGSSSVSPVGNTNPPPSTATTSTATVTVQGSTVLAIRGQSAQLNSGRPVTRQKHPRMALDLFGSGHSGGALGVVRQHGGGLGGGGVVVSNYSSGLGGLGDDQTYVFSSENAEYSNPTAITPPFGAVLGQSPVVGTEAESDGLLFSTSSVPRTLGNNPNTVSPMIQPPQQQVPSAVDFSCLFFKSENELDDEGQELFPTKAQAQLQKERERLRKVAGGGGPNGITPNNVLSGEWAGGGKEDREPLQPVIIESAWWFTSDVEPELVNSNNNNNNNNNGNTASVSPTANQGGGNTNSTTPTSLTAGAKAAVAKAKDGNVAKESKSSISPQQVTQSVGSNFTSANSLNNVAKSAEVLAPLSIFSSTLNNANAQWDSLPITDGKPRFNNRRSSSGQNGTQAIGTATPRRISSQVVTSQVPVASTPTSRPLLSNLSSNASINRSSNHKGLKTATPSSEKSNQPVQLEITNSRPSLFQKRNGASKKLPASAKELTDDDDEEVLFFDAEDEDNDNEETQLYEMLVNRRKQQNGVKPRSGGL